MNYNLLSSLFESTTSKKLTKSMLAAGILLSSTAHAAIIHTDIADGVPAGIDFNQDGTNEFEVDNGFSSTGDYITYWDTHQQNNNIFAEIGGGWDVPEPLTVGATIDANGNWAGAGDCSIMGWGGTPTFPIGTDTYLGAKFELIGQVYYGWIRVNVAQTGTDAWGDPSYTVTYLDYAYEDVPGVQIEAGDVGSSVGIKEEASVISYIIQNDKIHFSDQLTYQVNNINGQLISSGLDNRVDFSSLNSGIYILKVALGNHRESIKIFVD